VEVGAGAPPAVEQPLGPAAAGRRGGRQLDTSIATLDALGPIAEALAGAAPAGGGGPELQVDRGGGRGTDGLKARAHGARAVGIGRPVLWGLALGGSAGVERVLAMLRDELDLALALAGARTPSEVTRDLLV
jgi:4-hydroxymandelate oxidase